MTWNVCVTHGMCNIIIDSDDLPNDELVLFGAPTVLPDTADRATAPVLWRAADGALATTEKIIN